MAITVSVSSPSRDNARWVYNYTASTTSFGTNRYNTGSWDLFSNSFAVDDAIYFGAINYLALPLIELVFDIGTAIAATSYTLVWEVSIIGGAWEAITPTKDDTNSFATTGTGLEVRFDCPSNHHNFTVNGTNTKWIRCRISAVDTPTEGGAIGTGAVTARTADIEIDGGTAGSPADIQDIIDDTVVANYNLIEEIIAGDTTVFKSYLIKARITVLSTCVFSETNKYFIFKWGYFRALSTSTEGATINFGVSTGGIANVGSGGCFISNYHNTTVYLFGATGTNATINLYCSRMESRRGQNILYSGTFNVYGSQLFGDQPFYGGGSFNIYNSTIRSVNSYTSSPTVFAPNFNNSSFDYIQAYQSTNGYIARECNMRVAQCMFNTTLVLYDCSYDIASTYGSTLTAENRNHRYEHLNLSIDFIDASGDPIAGVSVVIKDKDGNTPTAWVGNIISGAIVDVTTQTSDANGNIKTDLLYKHWTRIFYPSIVDTTYTYNPFTVTCSKAGYQTYSFEISDTSKQTLLIALEKQVPMIFVDGEKPVLNLSPAKAVNPDGWLELD